MATVADCLRQRLFDRGVGRVCGHPGDGVTGTLVVVLPPSERISFVQSRQAALAAFMVSGHAPLRDVASDRSRRP